MSDNTPRVIPLQNIFCNTTAAVQVVDIYDGDTLTVLLPFHGVLYRTRVRLSGIDCNERGSEEDDDALAAKRALVELVTNGSSCPVGSSVKHHLQEHPAHVFCCFGCLDKYGRVLARVYKSQEDQERDVDCFNDLLLKRGLAAPY